MGIDTNERIESAFAELCALVDRGALVRLPEGLWTLEDYDRVWVVVGVLARLLFVRAMTDPELRAAFEMVTWGLARFEVRTADDGEPELVNAHRWQVARDRFARVLERRRSEPHVA